MSSSNSGPGLGHVDPFVPFGTSVANHVHSGSTQGITTGSASSSEVTPSALSKYRNRLFARSGKKGDEVIGFKIYAQGTIAMLGSSVGLDSDGVTRAGRERSLVGSLVVPEYEKRIAALEDEVLQLKHLLGYTSAIIAMGTDVLRSYDSLMTGHFDDDASIAGGRSLTLCHSCSTHGAGLCLGRCLPLFKPTTG